MTPITAQFLHQHKDKVICEQIIFIDSPRLEQYYASDSTYLVFEIPIVKHEFFTRWLKSNRFLRVTWRSMRFLNPFGAILYQLSKRPLKVKLDTNNRKYNMWVIEVTCLVHKDEICELSKIFAK